MPLRVAGLFDMSSRAELPGTNVGGSLNWGPLSAPLSAGSVLFWGPATMSGWVGVCQTPYIEDGSARFPSVPFVLRVPFS